jgi:hypothetical protein
VLRRSPAAVSAQLMRAKARLQARAVSYSDPHHQAAQVAAAKGDGRPAEWALERLRVVEPIESRLNTGIVVQVGCVLPGLHGSELPVVTAVPVADVTVAETPK